MRGPRRRDAARPIVTDRLPSGLAAHCHRVNELDQLASQFVDPCHPMTDPARSCHPMTGNGKRRLLGAAQRGEHVTLCHPVTSICAAPLPPGPCQPRGHTGPSVGADPRRPLARLRQLRLPRPPATQPPRTPGGFRPAGSPGAPLLQVVLELAAARGVAQLAQRLGFDLADALARHVELLAHLLERAGAAVLQAEAQLQHAPLAP